MSKLWQKDTKTEGSVEKFTVGNDRELDNQLAAFDSLFTKVFGRKEEGVKK